MKRVARFAWFVSAFLLFAAWSVFPRLAHAQSTCRHYVNTVNSMDYEGTLSGACAYVVGRYTAQGRAASLTSCVQDGTFAVVGMALSNPTENTTFYFNSVGECSGDPEPQPSGLVPIDWANPVHLTQALFIASLCIALFIGYRSGDKL